MEKTENREMRMTRTFKASIDLMWEVWTNPEHIVNWWGPKGFSNTIHKMELKEGGEWKLTMHGPDGTDFPNRSIFKEIIPFKKIVFEHFNPHFITTVLFESKGEETQIDWSLLFDTAEMREIVIKAHKADEGQKQNLDKLEKYLSDYEKNEAYNQLRRFIGDWRTEGIIPSSNKNPEIKIKGTDTYEWIVDGCFVLHKADVLIGNNNSKTHEIIGYDSLNHHYTMQHYDNGGNAGFMTATVNNGRWIFIGDNLRFKGGFNEDEDVFSGVWEQLKDHETWSHLMDIKLSKKTKN